MDLYLKDPPIFGHISFIVEAVIKGESAERRLRHRKLNLPLRVGKIGDTIDTTSLKRVQRSSEAENMAGPSGRVYLDTRAWFSFVLSYDELLIDNSEHISTLPLDVQSRHQICGDDQTTLGC